MLRVTKIILLNLIILILLLVTLEAAYRAVYYFARGPEAVISPVVSDDKFGWVHNTNARTSVRNNRCGEEVVRTPSAHELINRFPATSSGRPILFIGDSTTHAHEVSSGQAYYDIFENEEGVEFSVYAAGTGGYGNLQEYLVLDAVFDEVNPDIVVWQLDPNDIRNNVYQLDHSSIYNNQRPRPYLIDGNIQVMNPGFWLFDWSKGFLFVFRKTLIIDRKFDLGFLNWLNSFRSLEPEDNKMYRTQGLNVLDVVLRKVAENYPKTTFIGFSVAAKDDSDFEHVFKKNGLSYFPGFYKYLSEIEGTDCQPLDGHWNHLGNTVAGKKLRELIEAELRPASSASIEQNRRTEEALKW